MGKTFFKLKEKTFKRLFLFQDYYRVFARMAVKVCRFFFFLLSLVYLTFFIVQIGFPGHEEFHPSVSFFKDVFYGLFLLKYVPDFLTLKKRKRIRWIIDAGLLVAGVWLHTELAGFRIESVSYSVIRTDFVLLNLYVILLVLSEMYHLFRVIHSVRIAPALLFVLSFLSVILIGSGLLMMPNAQAEPVSYLDALFTSASAVCVTGLIVVDTSSAYTPLGQAIILGLIQLGGLGIMTFTAFFGYIFTGSASFRDHVLVREMLSSDSLGGLFRIIILIIGVTFLLEAAGTFLIYTSLEPGEVENSWFFSVFHAVSAFCNAGFSTLSEGLSTAAVEKNRMLKWVVAWLIIVGGLGFPVLLFLFSYLRVKLVRLTGLFNVQRVKQASSGGNTGHRIVLVTTTCLLLLGTVAYYWLENQGSLNRSTESDRWLTAFFGSVSARTAGFNVVDISAWSYPTIFLMVFLMWVGASPGSTGGGIKTTTFALALKTSYDFVRGRNLVEIRNREIGTETLYRVLVVIILSVLVIFIGFFVLLMVEPAKDPVRLLFESFSAYGTVGLSLVNTSTLGETGKMTIIVLMFVGRLGPLTVLTGLFISDRKRYHRFPKQDFIIN
ncbi:MAG: TrkH family potassium uptake protein [Mangrovibacterium sp.]